MKKTICFLIVFMFVIVFCSGCEGDITRSLRYEGFSVGGDFSCDEFMPEDKDDTSYKKIRYLTSSSIISEDGELYEISLGQKYANNSNCKKADTDLDVVSLFDDKVFKSSDGKYYYLKDDGTRGEKYTEVASNDSDYPIIDLLLKQTGTYKVNTVDSKAGIYYALKNDGNVYSYKVVQADRNTPPAIESMTMVYNKNDFSGSIIDFNYYGENSGSTFVMSDSKAFKMYVKNEKECTKYADVACKFEMREFESYTENKDYILAYNGSLLITTYGKTFNVIS